MNTHVDVSGVQEALRALSELPKRIRLRHVRIALNAGGGVSRDRYAASVKRETGILSKSMGVKVIIPDASYNEAHHGKPAKVIIGVKRKAGRFLRRNKSGNLKGYAAANRALKANRSQQVNVTALQREINARQLVEQTFADAKYQTPSRYAHLAGPGRRGSSVLNSSFRQSQPAALAKMTEKLKQGISTETAALGPK